MTCRGLPGIPGLRILRIAGRVIRNPGQFRHNVIPCRKSRGGKGREDVSGDTCRELLKTAAEFKVELPQVFQVSDTPAHGPLVEQPPTGGPAGSSSAGPHRTRWLNHAGVQTPSSRVAPGPEGGGGAKGRAAGPAPGSGSSGPTGRVLAMKRATNAMAVMVRRTPSRTSTPTRRCSHFDGAASRLE